MEDWWRLRLSRWTRCARSGLMCDSLRSGRPEDRDEPQFCTRRATPPHHSSSIIPVFINHCRTLTLLGLHFCRWSLNRLPGTSSLSHLYRSAVWVRLEVVSPMHPPVLFTTTRVLSACIRNSGVFGGRQAPDYRGAAASQTSCLSRYLSVSTKRRCTETTISQVKTR